MFEEYETVVIPEELAEMLRISLSETYKLLKSKKIAAYKEGRSWKITKESVIKYVRERSGY